MFHGDKLLLRKDALGNLHVPQSSEPPVDAPGMRHAVGLYGGLACMAQAVDRLPSASDFETVGLRACFDIIGKDLYLVAGRGWQMIHWDAHSRFCPVCGTKTELLSSNAKRCPACSNEMFPPIADAILALIRKDDQALLVRARTFRGPNYGLVAGFLEPGETFEECVRREVYEETALSVANIRYFGSQPWPYPSGLMVGFLADYAGGRISLLDNELCAAEFFSRDNLPELPHKLSLARQMIDWWIEGEPDPFNRNIR